MVDQLFIRDVVALFFSFSHLVFRSYSNDVKFPTNVGIRVLTNVRYDSIENANSASSLHSGDQAGSGSDLGSAWSYIDSDIVTYFVKGNANSTLNQFYFILLYTLA